MPSNDLKPRPTVRPGDEISIGGGHGMPGKQAVVAMVNSDETVEVVYLDNKGKAIAEPVKWTGDGWTFVHKGPAGTYAENSSRFAPYAKIAKARFSRH